jgi:hypothetical protein
VHSKVVPMPEVHLPVSSRSTVAVGLSHPEIPIAIGCMTKAVDRSTLKAFKWQNLDSKMNKADNKHELKMTLTYQLTE